MSRSRDVAGAVLAACLAASAFAARAEDDEQAVLRLHGEIDAIVAEHGNCHNVVQCRVLTMGFDACGNPTYQIAFNNATGVRPALEAKAAEITFLEEESWRDKPRPSECRRVDPPVVACHRSRCATGIDHDY